MNSLKGIALGTFPFANVFGIISEDEIYRIVKRFIENDGEFIHVSLVYNNGEVERLLGRILKKFPRDSYKIMACCGWGIKDDKFSLSGLPSDIQWCCDGVLQRMRLDYIDVLMSHGPDITTPYEITSDAMESMVNSGKAMNLCVSNVSLDQLKRYNYKNNIKYIQNRFSFLNQSITEDMFSYCKDNDIKVTTYQSIERGLLTDRILQNLVIDSNDLRSKKPEFQRQKMESISNFVKEYLYPIANRNNISIQTLVIYWALKEKGIFSTLCGISKEKYFKDFYDINSIEIPKTDVDELNSSYSIFSSMVLNEYNCSIRDFLGIVF